MNETLWYKDAIIYQLHVRSFFDSVGDGIGDFGGLRQKLDYLHDLGVTALWIMPFYPSPLRDDGYDTADYLNVHRHYGSLDSFRRFLDAAHERDLKVITELVINHTSDQHAWFQRARRAPPGSVERDFYVWSDTPEKYKGARIIFKDFEPSNWTYDHVAKAYFWHRFYSHQPDLNYDNPAVRAAVLPLVDFWMEMGVDGLRLDAIPYLYEREETNCENLPETHAFLKELRSHVDARFAGRMLLAEANQWPEDAVAYFGNGDECHMAFHFPVMPRLFMAIHREDRFPIVDIMDQTPAIPPNCQWAMFLRNHDELTLEMVTDEERDYMYRAYATDPEARINLGIRRRLSPLLSSNRRRIELMNGLLFSLPGTPVIYYGDEIGMGDNIYLGDRNGVRTPMQWSADRNAGFSRANPQKLFLPIIIDPEYHYEAVNVEAQQNNPHSLLWWMKRLIDMRKRSAAFSRGTLEFLHPENRKVLAFLRRLSGETVLVVANLSRFLQYVELDLSELAGATPVEFFGGTRLPVIGKAPYLLTLGPHSFYWFQLQMQPAEVICPPGGADLSRLPVLTVRDSWIEVLQQEEDDFERALAGYLSCSMFSTGRVAVKAARLRDAVRLPLAGSEALLVILDADTVSGESERYSLPLMLAEGAQQDEIAAQRPGSIAARVSGGQTGLVYEAIVDPRFCGQLMELIAQERRLPTRGGGELAGWRLAPIPDAALFTPLKMGHAVTVNLDNRLLLKWLRKVDVGPHPEFEFGRFFHRCPRTAPVARLLGGVELESRRSGPIALAAVHEYVVNEGDALQYTLDALSIYFERVAALDSAAEPPPSPSWRRGAAAPAERDELFADYLDSVRLLGGRTAELHAALASDADDPNFAPEPFTPLYQRSRYQFLRGQSLQALDELQRQLAKFPESERAAPQALLARRGAALAQIHRILTQRLEAVRIRCHGDFHLGQLVFTGKDFVVIDFEGSAHVPLSERRIKRSPLSDVASMMRSFEYSARAALAGLVSGRGQTPGTIRPADLPRVSAWTKYWVGRVTSTFLSAYLSQPEIAALLPTTESGIQMLLEFFSLERAFADLRHELHYRPAWIGIAIQSALELLDELDGA